MGWSQHLAGGPCGAGGPHIPFEATNLILSTHSFAVSPWRELPPSLDSRLPSYEIRSWPGGSLSLGGSMGRVE